MDFKKRIIITGQKVHDIGYRPFLLGIAESFEIERFFADNILIEKKQAVYALVDSSEEKVEAFIEIASSKYPENSDVEKVDVEDYSGNVMRIESYYRYLTAMQLSKIATYGGRMLGKQDKMLEMQGSMLDKQGSMLDKQDKMLDKQDKMLDKQDLQTEITKDGFNDMRKGFADLKEEVRMGFADVKEEIHMQRDDFREVFMHEVSELRGEIAEIKATLARMQAAG